MPTRAISAVAELLVRISPAHSSWLLHTANIRELSVWFSYGNDNSELAAMLLLAACVVGHLILFT